MVHFLDPETANILWSLDPDIVEMVQFMDSETAEIFQFLDSEIVKMETFLEPENVEMVQFLDPEIVEKVDKSFLNLLQLQNKLPGWGQMGWVAWTWLSLVITSFFKIKYHTMTMQYAFFL